MSRNFLVILYWIPILMGLFLYDVPFKVARRNGTDISWMVIIGSFSILAILLDIFLIIPFAIFLFIYLSKMFMVKRKINQLGNGLGMLGYSFLFVLTFGNLSAASLLLVVSLFIFMLGSEFTVRSVTTGNRALLIYNIIPPLFVLLNPVFLVFTLSLGRIPVALLTGKVKIIGVIETVFMITGVIVLVLFYVLRF